MNSLQDERALTATAEAPTPAEGLELDPGKVAAWVASDPDPQVKVLRQEMASCVQIVHFDEFKARVVQISETLDTEMAASGERYGVLLDDGPRKSKAWVHQLAYRSESPEADASFFDNSLEAEAGFPTIYRMLDEGVNAFVIKDDAIYSGEQVLNRIIRPLAGLMESEAYKASGYADRHVRIVVAAPYISQTFLANEDVRRFMDQGLLEIVGGYELMPSLDTMLSEESATLLRALGRPSSSDDGLEFYNPPLFVFDHKIPDQHSFPPHMAGLFTHIPRAPYKSDAAYVADDEARYNQYATDLFARIDQLHPQVTSEDPPAPARVWKSN